MLAMSKNSLRELLVVLGCCLPGAAWGASSQSSPVDTVVSRHETAPVASTDVQVVLEAPDSPIEFTVLLPGRQILLTQQEEPNSINDLIITLLSRAMEKQQENDRASAFAFYEQAARLGSGTGAALAGRMLNPLMDGDSLRSDPVKAYELYHQALELGLHDIQPELEALEAWAIKHADRQDPEAQALMGRMKALTGNTPE